MLRPQFANSSRQAKSSQMPVSVIKVLLEYSHVYSFLYCHWLPACQNSRIKKLQLTVWLVKHLFMTCPSIEKMFLTPNLNNAYIQHHLWNKRIGKSSKLFQWQDSVYRVTSFSFCIPLFCFTSFRFALPLYITKMKCLTELRTSTLWLSSVIC